jgi:23S rRNA (cytosine1962-C5)-methyltransferase
MKKEERRRPAKGRPAVRKGTLRLHDDVARRIRLGHPWVYKEALDPRRALPPMAQVVDLVDWGGEFVGRGVVDGTSAIAVRVVTRQVREVLTPDLISGRVRKAIALRKRLFNFDRDQSLRLVNAESDGLPAVIVERYGDYLVVQLGTPAVQGWCEAIYDALEAELAPKAIYEQRRYKPVSGEAPRGGAQLVRGLAAPVELETQEGDYRFLVDVTAPLSTGLFIDLREGRRAVQRWAKDRRVLNLFSYTGAISVYAARGGASRVTGVDVAAKPHARARRNFALNGMSEEEGEHITGDVMKTLARFEDRKRDFDLIVADPPAFGNATKGARAWSAQRDYKELVASCLRVLTPGGVLVAVSSTHKFSHADFELALAEGAMRAGRGLQIVERQGLPCDFPIHPAFGEANYLKFAVSIAD